MPFTVSDFRDLIELLEQNPSWRAELRRLVLTDELLQLPKVVEDLAATVDRLARNMEEGFRRVDKAIADLAAAQQRTDQRLQRVEEQIEALAAAQRRTEAPAACGRAD